MLLQPSLDELPQKGQSCGSTDGFELAYVRETWTPYSSAPALALALFARIKQQRTQDGVKVCVRSKNKIGFCT